MYPIFKCVSVLFLFQSAFPVDTASDKESLQKSLGQVSRFLENVGQSIQQEKYYLDTVTRENSDVPTYRGKVLNKDASNNINFNSIKFSTLNNSKLRYNNSKAAMLLNEYENDNADQESNIRSANQSAGEKKENKIEHLNQMKVSGRKDKGKEGRESDVDIFGDMVFPPKSELPDVVVKFPEANNSEVIIPNIIPEKVIGGPDPEKLYTPTTTTEMNDILLDPKDFGFTTTRKPLPTYGDAIGPVNLPSKYITTPKAPTAFVEAFKSDMTRLGMGVFSTTLLKIFHWVIYKKPEVTSRLVWGFAKLVEYYDMNRLLDSFGQPTKHAFLHTTNKAANMPADERRAQAIMLHNALQHRWDMLSEEVNSILDQIDSLYRKDETKDLINSVEALEEYANVSGVPYTLLKTFLHNVLAPWTRLKDTFRGETLKNNLNGAIKKRFYSDKHYFPDKYRTANQTKNEILSRKHNIEKTSDEQKKDDNLLKNEESIEQRNDKNLKIIQWIPNVTYRTSKDKHVEKKPGAKYTNERNDSDDDTIEKDYLGIMSAMTEPSRAVSIRPKNKNKVINKNKIMSKYKIISKNKITNRNKIMNKRKKEIEKKLDPVDDYSKDQVPDMDLGDRSELKLSNVGSKSTKKHHKKRHSRHKHKHSISIRGLKKLLRIIKYLRPHHKNNKHRKHRHRSSNYWRNFRADSNGNGKTSKHLENKDLESKLTLDKTNNNNKFHFETGKPATFVIPTNEIYKYVTQSHNKSNLAFRRSMAINKEFKKVQAMKKNIRAESTGSDEEILLKINLLKAMGGENNLNKFLKSGRRGLLDTSECSSDEEMFLKRQIYKYFQEG